MTLSDVIALAKQGYKPGDIKELIALADDKQENPPVDQQPEIIDTTGAENLPTDSEVDVPPVNTDTNSALEERLKALEEQNKALAAQLKVAQDANVNRDHSDEFHSTDPFAELTELFRKG